METKYGFVTRANAVLFHPMYIFLSDLDELVFSSNLFYIHLVDAHKIFNLTSDDSLSIKCDCIKKAASYYRKKEADFE